MEGPPEVRELAEDMNSMADRLRDMLRAEREFAANASHQLRTPLAALRLSLEEAVAGPDPRGEASHALDQVDRLSAAVDALLRLGHARERGSEPIDLAGVARLVIAALDLDGLIVEVQGGGVAAGEPERVRQVIGNLVDNASRFARHRIEIPIETAGNRVILRVDDDGPGIPPGDLDRVFDRFYRGRTTGGPGSGLGLAVARELTRADGGLIRAAKSPLGGARFEVEWPAAQPADLIAASAPSGA
jgi:signal transduction histidine kinase